MAWVHGSDLSMMGDDDYAFQIIHHLTMQLRVHPDDRQLYFQRANAYLDRGEFQNAIDDYTRAIDLEPQDPIAVLPTAAWSKQTVRSPTTAAPLSWM